MMPPTVEQSLHLEPHPAAASLRAENALLREELTKLITDRDYLTTTMLPTIEAEYNLKIGGLEYEAYALDCRVRRARRQLELANSYLNRNAAVPFETIEHQLDDEFKSWQEKIEDMRRDLEAAQAFELTPCLSASDTRELQTIYRRLAKRLHPDLNPRQTARERNLWLQVADAYREAALAELRTLNLLLGDESTEIGAGDDANSPVLDALRQRRDELRAHIDRALARLAHIKSNAPYTLQEKLNDATWLAARAAELRQQIAQSKERFHALETAFRELTGATTNADSATEEEEEWADIIWEN